MIFLCQIEYFEYVCAESNHLRRMGCCWPTQIFCVGLIQLWRIKRFCTHTIIYSTTIVIYVWTVRMYDVGAVIYNNFCRKYIVIFFL